MNELLDLNFKVIQKFHIYEIASFHIPFEEITVWCPSDSEYSPVGSDPLDGTLKI